MDIQDAQTIFEKRFKELEVSSKYQRSDEFKKSVIVYDFVNKFDDEFHFLIRGKSPVVERDKATFPNQISSYEIYVKQEI